MIIYYGDILGQYLKLSNDDVEYFKEATTSVISQISTNFLENVWKNLKIRHDFLVRNNIGHTRNWI